MNMTLISHIFYIFRMIYYTGPTYWNKQCRPTSECSSNHKIVKSTCSNFTDIILNN